MTYDGDLLHVAPALLGGPLHLVLVDLRAGKDTVEILRALQVGAWRVRTSSCGPAVCVWTAEGRSLVWKGMTSPAWGGPFLDVASGAGVQAGDRQRQRPSRRAVRHTSSEPAACNFCGPSAVRSHAHLVLLPLPHHCRTAKPLAPAAHLQLLCCAALRCAGGLPAPPGPAARVPGGAAGPHQRAHHGRGAGGDGGGGRTAPRWAGQW